MKNLEENAKKTKQTNKQKKKKAASDGWDYTPSLSIESVPGGEEALEGCQYKET